MINKESGVSGLCNAVCGEENIKLKSLYINMYKNVPFWVKDFVKWSRLLPNKRIQNKEAVFTGVEILGTDRPGIIHDITKCFASRNINISRFLVYAVPPSGGLYDLVIEAASREQINCIKCELENIPGVIGVTQKSKSMVS